MPPTIAMVSSEDIANVTPSLASQTCFACSYLPRDCITPTARIGAGGRDTSLRVVDDHGW